MNLIRWPPGSCPECYEAGTPERPICEPHGHELVSIAGVTMTMCDIHEHAKRPSAQRAALLPLNRKVNG